MEGGEGDEESPAGMGGKVEGLACTLRWVRKEQVWEAGLWQA